MGLSLRRHEFVTNDTNMSPMTNNLSLYIYHLKNYVFFGSGQEENRTPMTARSPHFECGASTSFATRPFIQLSQYTLFYDFATTNLKIKKF